MNWSRYTILTGLVLLLANCAIILRCVEHQDRFLIVSSFLIAGLMTTHYRLLAFFGVFAVVVVITQFLVHRRVETLWKSLLTLMGIGAFAGVLVAPWFTKIFEFARLLINNRLGASALPPATQTSATYAWLGDWLASFYLIVPRTFDRLLFILAIVGIILAVLTRRRNLMLVMVWYVLLFILAAFQFLSLTFEDNSGDLVAITVFYLLALFSATTLITLARKAQMISRFANTVIHFPIVKEFALLFVLWLGVSNLLGLVDASTIIYTQSDEEAMAWIRQNSASDSIFLNNAYHWRGDVFYGADGGYWIQLKTHRRVTLPPLIYGFAPIELKNKINELANLTFMPQDWNDEKLIQSLREQKVNYIYLGQHGGQMKAEMFDASPYYQLVFSNSRVRIFKIKDLANKPM